MNILRKLALGGLLCTLSLAASAHQYTLGGLKIGHPWARATVAGQSAGGGFFKIENTGKADRLLGVSSDVAETAELHTMEMDGDVMKMHPVPAIEIPAGGTVELKPGGFHVMFVKLKAPLKENTRFPLTLRFEKAGEIKVEVAVEPLAQPARDAHEGMKH